MKKLFLAAIWLALLATGAHASQPLAITGLFCLTQAQVEQTLAHIRDNMTVAAAIALTNRTEVVCVNATQVRYMVVNPAIAGTVQHYGASLKLYRGTLVGILVGGNPRPIEPALPIFFVTRDPMPVAGSLIGI